MKLRNKLTSLGATVLVVSLLAACSGAAPEDDPVLGAPPSLGTNATQPATPGDDPTDNEQELNPEVEKETVDLSEAKEDKDYDPRAQERIFAWTPEDLAPLKKHKEVFGGEDVENIMIDTVLLLQSLSSFTDYQAHGIPDDEVDLLISSFAEGDMTERATKELSKEVKDTTLSAMIILPHRIDGTSAHDRVVDFDEQKAWNITYSDLESYDVLSPGEVSKSAQAPFGIVQTMKIPDKSGDTLTIRTEMVLYMEPGFDRWVLNNWSLKSMTSEWSNK